MSSGESILWQTLGLLGLLALWGVVALLPWAAAHLATRGRLALVALPLAFAAGIGGGTLVPALGGDDLFAVGISLLAAFAAGALAVLLCKMRLGRREI